MRTTIDIPESLLRRATAEAALRGLRLTDFVTEAVRSALEGAPGYGDDERQMMAEDVVFPVIRGPGGTAMRDLTAERIHEILEAEEVEHVLRPSGTD